MPSTVAPYDDEAALQRFADAVDVVTFEFENIPDSAAEFLATRRPTRPKPFVLHICQQRLREKDFLALNGVPVTRYLPVPSREALDEAVRRLGLPAILKSAQFGYDGKGQVRLTADVEPGRGLDPDGRAAGHPGGGSGFRPGGVGHRRAQRRRTGGALSAGGEPPPASHTR